MVRLKEAENSATIKNLKNKIDDLEQVCWQFCLLAHLSRRLIGELLV